MSIKKNTLLTTDQAITKLEDRDFELSGKQRILFREYAECLSRLDMMQEQFIPNLLNRKGIQSEDWIKVHQLVDDLSYQRVDERLRQKLKELEQALKDEGAL